MKRFIIFFALSLFSIHAAIAQEEDPRSIYVIFDASGSMWGKLPDDAYKIHAARSVLEDFMAEDLGQAEVAFRAYGHRREGDCSDTELVVPFTDAGSARASLKSFLKDVNPKGKTPIHRSLSAALTDFGDRQGDIVLITDGIETCNADPCALMKEWREKDIDIDVHVVGFGLEEKEKEALACISEEAGTPFYEANSAADLSEQLRNIKEQTATVGFSLTGLDKEGNRMRAKGKLVAEDGTEYEVTSNGRFHIPPGDYTLIAGVETKNGSIYQPAQKEVTVASVGDTRESLEVVVPPSVAVSFTENGVAADYTAQVSVYQDGEELFHFRSFDLVYIDEGTYEFRASPNADNQDITVVEKLESGEAQQVVFDLQKTIRMHAKMFSAGSNERIREHLYLYQDGEQKYRVHTGNKARVMPGTYIIRMENTLHSYEEEITITDEEGQEFNITVPVGHVTVKYQTADGQPDEDARCFVSRQDSNSTVYWETGNRYPLRPGKYKVAGWRSKGNYETVSFEVKEGEDTEVILRAQ